MPVSTNTTKYLVPVGDTAPDVDSVPVGSLWFNNELGQLYVLYQDVDSLQWVQTSTSESPVI
jgi:hypothetical protein